MADFRLPISSTSTHKSVNPNSLTFTNTGTGTGTTSYNGSDTVSIDLSKIAASTADALATSTTFNVNLAGATATSYNGSQTTVNVSISNQLKVANGGTGQTSYTIGDILYASSTSVLSKLGGNTTTTRKFLRSVAATSGTAVAPAWDTVTATDVGLSDVTNTAALNKNTGAKGDIIYWSATNTPAHLTNTSSTTKNFLSITSQVPAWTTLSKSDVGLGNVTNDAQIKAALGTAKGDLLYWSASATPARLGIGTNGYFLTVSNGAPAWSALPTASTGTAGIMKVGTGLSASSGTVSVSYGTSASTALQGNATLVTLNGTNKNASSVASFYAPTSAGTSGQYLKSSGSGAPTWANLPTLSATSSGSGNVVTAISASNHAITYTLGTISTVSAQIIRW